MAPRDRHRTRWSAAVVLAAGLLAAAAPSAVEAWSALTLVRWHGARGAAAIASAEAARRVGRDAARVVALTAPLPWAGQAAAAAIDVATPLVASRPQQAVALLDELRAALDPVAASSWRGYGLAAFAARAVVLSEAARAAVEAEPNS